jgi:hypothetical protein
MLYANLRDATRPQHSRIFLNPDPEAAKADQRPALSKPSQGRNQPTGHGRPIPSPVVEHRAPQTSAHRRGPEPAVMVVALVRAGSARHRKPLVHAGHQRSRPAYKNRRSHGLHRSGLGLPSSRGPGSNPSASATRTGHLRLQHPSAGTRHQGRPRAGSTTTLRRRRPIAQLLGGPGRSRTFPAASPGSAATTRRRVHPTFTRTRGAPAVTSWRLGRSPTAAP